MDFTTQVQTAIKLTQYYFLIKQTALPREKINEEVVTTENHREAESEMLVTQMVKSIAEHLKGTED